MPSLSSVQPMLPSTLNRRRKRETPLLRNVFWCFFLTLSVSSPSITVSAFTPLMMHHRTPPTAHWATKSTKETTWSRSTEGSRLGVRKRVKDVLEKAKMRTGLVNRNSDAMVVAAASSSSSNMGSFTIDSDLLAAASTPTNAYNRNRITTHNMTDFLVPYSFQNGYSDSYVPKNGKNNGYSDPTIAAANGKVNGQVQPTQAPQLEAVSSSAMTSTPNVAVAPLPFTLPTLTAEQEAILAADERVQEQSKMGREGSGYVVMDISAPPQAIWECLLDFEAYPDHIGTVRSVRMFTNTHLQSSYIAESPVSPGSETRHMGTPSITRASFVLSKFQLQIAAVHQYQPHPQGDYMVFTLDRACTNVVLQDAQGIWYTQAHPTDPTKTRVWLLCKVRVSSLLPSFIVDYTAQRAMPRATTWLPKLVQANQHKWKHIANGAAGVNDNRP
jgi:hypothetical protein